MNAALEQAGRLRGQAPRNGAMRKMPAIAVSRQPKPVFQVLESAAIENADSEAKENRRSDKKESSKSSDLSPKLRFPDSTAEPENIAAGSHYTDDDLSAIVNNSNLHNPLLFNNLRQANSTVVPFGNLQGCTTVSIGQEAAADPRGVGCAVRVSGTLFYKYQAVTHRKVVPFQPNPKKAPGYILWYCVETLACGHKHVVHPIEGEHLTARRRCCHECSGLFGGVPQKKPAGKSKQAQRGRATGKGIVPAIAFAIAAMLIILALLWHYQPKVYIYSAPADTWRILSDVTPKDNGYEVVMQRVHEGRALPPWEMHFCSDYKPLFEIGMSLTWFAYEDRGACISVSRKDLGYVIERRSDTWPTLARNCNYRPDPSVAWGMSSICAGKPLFD